VRQTQKSVGIRGLAPRISKIVIPYRGDSTKARFLGGSGGVSPFEPLGDRLFRAFAVRDENGSDGRVRICAPHVVLRFEGLKNRFRTKEFLKPGFSPLK
jgi:hypothetical protein